MHRADDHASLRDRVIPKGHRDAEVGYLDARFGRDQDVLGLDIPVDQPDPVSVFEGGGDLAANVDHPLRREGAFLTNHYAPDVPWESSKAFVVNYQARFHRPPSSLAAQGYDAARILADALGRAKGATPNDLRDGLQETKGFAGATGVITIDDDRNADKSVVIVQIKDKKFTYYTSMNDKQAGAPK